YAGEGKSQRLFAVTAVVTVIIMIVASFGSRLVALKGRDNERAGQVGAKCGKEKKFALGIHIRALSKIVAQVAFGQKVGEEDRNAASHRTEIRHEPARTALEGQAQGGTLRIVDIVLLEREELPVACKAGDYADLFSVQAHGKRVQFLRVKPHRAAPRSCLRRGRRHRGAVPLLRPADP